MDTNDIEPYTDEVKTTKPLKRFGCQSLPLPKICSISKDCLTLTCRVNFLKKSIILTFGINKCDNPVSLGARIQIPKLGLDLKKTLSSNTLFPIPQFGYTFGIVKAGVFLKATIVPKKENLVLQVR